MLKGLSRRRLLLLGLGVVLLTAVILLAANLSQVRFSPGRPLSLGLGEPPQAGPIPEVSLDFLWQLLSWAFVVLLPVSLVAALIWPRTFKWALIRAVAMVAVLILTYLAIHALRDFIEEFLAALEKVGGAGEAPLPGADIAGELGQVRAPSWSVYPFLVVGLGLLALGGWLLHRRWLRLRLAREDRLVELAGLAGAAAAQLRRGRGLRDTVLRCYREMSELLSEREQVPFGEAMTPREFEQQLRRAGVQDEHVDRLSRLFELVRYGGRAPTEQEEREAISCLEAIEQAYGRPQQQEQAHRGAREVERAT